SNEATDLDGVRGVQGKARGVVGAEVLAPARAGHFVGDPQPALWVICEGTAAFEIRGCRDRDRIIEPDSITEPGAAHIDVVVALVVGVPTDGDFTAGAGSDGRIPIARARERDERFGGEGIAGLSSGEDFEIVVAEGLPCHPDAAGGVGGGDGEDVRSRVWGEPDLGSE